MDVRRLEMLHTGSSSVSTSYDADDSEHGSSVHLPSTRLYSGRVRFLTWYRILVTTLSLSFGIWKAVASFAGRAMLSNALDIVMGVVLGLLYVFCCTPYFDGLL